MAAATASRGKALLPRLPVYPRYLQQHQLLPSSSLQQQPEGQQLWLDATAGRDSPTAAVLRCADAEGLARGSTWFAGATEDAAEAPAAAGAGDSTRDQQHAAPPAPDQQQQAQHGELKSSMPRVRRRNPQRSWWVAVAGDGLLEGSLGPQQVSARVEGLLRGVLEEGHELSEADIEFLFSGKPAF